MSLALTRSALISQQLLITAAAPLEITASYTGSGDKAGAIIVDMDGNKNTDDDVTFNASIWDNKKPLCFGMVQSRNTR